MRFSFLHITLLLFVAAFSQTKEQRQAITKNYDLKKLNELSKTCSERYRIEKIKVLELAHINNWKIRYEENGITYELLEVTEDGHPIYLSTFNVGAALSTRANHLQVNGSLGLELGGQNLTINIWDSGHVRTTHQEFTNVDGSSRILFGDTWQAMSSHATHVMGTLMSSGIDIESKGMAPLTMGISYDWNDDIAEIAQAASEGMLVSNHSYGLQLIYVPDWNIGRYFLKANYLDQIMRNAPYYLLVVAAGNDGNNNTANGEPINNNPQYDKLSGYAVCKNGITVANALDAEVTSNGDLISVMISTDSSQGPTDDFRIKPDITGNGTNIYSTDDIDDFSYRYDSGTSMSTPNIAGSLLLLQQHYNNKNGMFMKASTLKGLALHTADDAGMIGPDAIWGWGLMNSKFAAQAITDNGQESLIIEETLYKGENYSITVQSDEINPLLTSISWTDYEGKLDITDVANISTPILVNDLDLRVSNGDVYEPWKLVDVDDNSIGDNNVDPFERVDINNANGSYTINISEKNLTDSQDFSLIITGINSHQLTLNSLNSFNKVCFDEEESIFNFSFLPQTGGDAANTSFSAQNIPEGTQVTLTNTENSVQMLVSNLQNLNSGIHIIDVTAHNNDQSITKPVTLVKAQTPELIYPKNNAIFDSQQFILLDWADTNYIESDYYLEIATDPDFEKIIYSNDLNVSEYTFEPSGYNTYYWRVKGESFCETDNNSAVYQFTNTSCRYYKADSVSTLIPDYNSADGLSVFYNCLKEFRTSDIALNLRISHNDIGSLWITLKSPSGTSTEIITPYYECNATNILSFFRDISQNDMYCFDTENNLSNNNLKPIESFSNFSGEFSVGMWELNIKSVNSNTIGTLEEWGIVFCDKKIGSYNNFFSMWPNPCGGIINLSFKADNTKNSTLNIYDLSGRLIQQYLFNKTINRYFKEKVDLSHLTNGFYIVQIINGKNIFSSKLLIM